MAGRLLQGVDELLCGEELRSEDEILVAPAIKVCACRVADALTSEVETTSCYGGATMTCDGRSLATFEAENMETTAIMRMVLRLAEDYSFQEEARLQVLRERSVFDPDSPYATETSEILNASPLLHILFRDCSGQENVSKLTQCEAVLAVAVLLQRFTILPSDATANGVSVRCVSKHQFCHASSEEKSDVVVFDPRPALESSPYE